MPRRLTLALLLNALFFAGLALFASKQPTLWAVRGLADWPWAWRGALATLPLIALLPPIANALARALERATAWLARAPRIIGIASLMASGALFWTFRERTLWGDALYTLALLEGRWHTTWRGEYFWKEPLDRLTVVATYQISHALIGWDAWHAIALISSLAGVVYVWIAWRLAGDLADDPLRRGLALGLLLSPGAIQLLFGHVENYTLVTVTALGYTWLAIRTIQGRSHPALAAGTLGLAIAFHPQAVFLAPSLVVLAWPDSGGWRARLRDIAWLAIGLAIPLLALMALGFLVKAPPLQIGVNRFADDTRLWLSPAEMLTPAHLLDVLNNLYLVAPAAMGVLLLLIGGWRPRTRVDAFLAVSTLGMVGYSLIFANKLPRPDDWDLYAIVAVPVTVWAASMVASAARAIASRVGVALTTVALCLTVPWVWSNYAHQRVELNPAKVDLLAIYRAYDLIAAFPQAQVQQPPQPLCEPKPDEDPALCQYVTVTQFTMPQTGDTRPVLVTHPPAQVSYRLQLPDQPSFLWLSLAMDPMTWGWGGDGATFVVTVDDGTSAVAVFQQHVGNRPEDQRWHDVTIDLTPWRGREITLTFRAEPGPANDYTGDRAGWGLMQILVGEPRLPFQGTALQIGTKAPKH